MSYTRRDFLRTAVGASALMSLGPTAPEFLIRSARAASPPGRGRDTVLVAIQLTGGNDGLNTVVPYADDEYGRSRSTLRLPTGELHKIDSLLAFHPRMEMFQRLYKDGCLSIVQGVGHPQPDQSHDRAMRIWHTADPQQPASQTGWLGRVADNAWSPTSPDATAVFVGPIGRPFALNAENVVVPSLRSAESLSVRGVRVGASRGTGILPVIPNHGRDAHATETPPDVTTSAKAADTLLSFLRRSTLDAHAKSERIIAAINAGTADYPSFGLAQNLRTIAQLVRADIGIRVFVAELGGGGIGGFDNHANQLGNHCALLHELAESVGAFLNDLKRDRLLDRVLVMTFSEFGRTVKENGRRGTDHGAAAPLFLAGGKVTGGLVGTHPSLTDLDNGALRFQIDFRRVYATVLDRWLGVDSRTVLGASFEPLDVLKA